MNETLIPTDGGMLVVSHSITMGDIITIVLLTCILFVMIYNNFSRRF
ncbi:hypothetical protein M3Y14_29155 [Bacillus thuringiensis]|nr:hypothetical protein [Bacillus thuringiensis]UYX52419.1 hypothetical protein M3Y14_29155 [Bacillus thuringiensis]